MGIYGLIVMDSLGCVDSIIFVLMVVELVIVDLMFFDSICVGNSVIIVVIFGFVQYEWSIGDIILIIIVLGFGFYEFMVMSVEVCIVVVSVEIVFFIIIFLVILGVDSICLGVMIVFIVIGDYFFYEW